MGQAQALAGDSEEGWPVGLSSWGRGWLRTSLTGWAPPPLPGGNSVTKKPWASVGEAGSGGGSIWTQVHRAASCLKVDTPEGVTPGQSHVWGKTHPEATVPGSRCSGGCHLRRAVQGRWGPPGAGGGVGRMALLSQGCHRDPRPCLGASSQATSPLPGPFSASSVKLAGSEVRKAHRFIAYQSQV